MTRAIPCVDVHLDKTLIWKEACRPLFSAPLFLIAETWKHPECPSTEDWIKTWHQRYGTLLSHKKEWNDAVCINMDAAGDYHTKWSQLERKRNITMWYITYMWNLKYDTNDLTHKTGTDTEDRPVVANSSGQGWCGRGMDWSLDSECGISRGKLFYMEWINKVLPYSTENCIQYPMIPQ